MSGYDADYRARSIALAYMGLDLYNTVRDQTEICVHDTWVFLCRVLSRYQIRFTLAFCSR